MPNTESAKKRLKQTAKRTIANKIKKSRMRTFIRKIREAVEKEDKAEAERLLPIVFTKIDKAQKGGCIHKNTAARRKSKVASWVSSL